MREGNIVVLNLAPKNRLSGQLSNTIGSLVLNEIIATVRNLPRRERYSTYVFLDEFQNFVGPDLMDALPEVRQLGLKFLLSHQYMDQLVKGDYDLTNLIFQAQSRLVFGVQGEDADTLAHEFASITYDPKRIKEEIYSRRQLIKGHKVVELSSWSDSSQHADSWQESYGKNWSDSTGRSQAPKATDPTKSSGSAEGKQEGRGRGGSSSHTSSQGRHQTLTPVYDEFEELSSRTYESFDEQKSVWARDIRNLRTGEALLRLVDDPEIRKVKVKRSATGYLRHDAVTLSQHFPELIDRMEDMIQRNFESDLFVSGQVIDQETEARLLEVINGPTIKLTSKPAQVTQDADPFA